MQYWIDRSELSGEKGSNLDMYPCGIATYSSAATGI